MLKKCRGFGSDWEATQLVEKFETGGVSIEQRREFCERVVGTGYRVLDGTAGIYRAL
jgi:hypothetical protein